MKMKKHSKEKCPAGVKKEEKANRFSKMSIKKEEKANKFAKKMKKGVM